MNKSKQKSIIQFPTVHAKDVTELITFQVSIDQFLTDLEELKKRDREANAYIGTFLGQVLAIEKKIDLALVKAYPSICDKMLGGKIAVLEKFLEHLETLPDKDFFGTEPIKIALPALKEIRDVRNKFAHDFTYLYCPSSDLMVTINFVKSWAMKLPAEKIEEESRDHFKSLLALTFYSRVLCEKLSFLAFAQAESP